jgi:hypothetical protein
MLPSIDLWCSNHSIVEAGVDEQRSGRAVRIVPRVRAKVSFENTECCLGRYGNKSKNNCNQKHYHSKLLKIKRNAPHPTPPATVVSIGATKDIGLTLGESEAGGALLLLLRLLDCDAYPQWRCTRFKLDLDRVRANEISGW